MFNMTVVAPLPAASVVGVNAEAAPAGRPETEKATAVGKVAPPLTLKGNA
jgi:hypothetical protein